MDDINEIMNAFSQLDFNNFTLEEKLEAVNIADPFIRFAKRMVVKYSSDLPQGSTFLFRMDS